MKKAFLFLLFSSSVFACTSPVSPAPDDLIPTEKMTSILVDVHVAEARIESMGLMLDTGAVHYKKLQQEIFKKHNISEKTFQKSYKHYLDNVSELDKIYEKVVDSLSLAETKAGAISPPNRELRRVQ